MKKKEYCERVKSVDYSCKYAGTLSITQFFLRNNNYTIHHREAGIKKKCVQ